MFQNFRERLSDRLLIPDGVQARFEAFENDFCPKPWECKGGKALLANTQFLDVVFLPTLVVMLSPPLQMFEDSKEREYVLVFSAFHLCKLSKIDRMTHYETFSIPARNVLAWVPKPTAAYKVFRMIQMMEYVEVGSVNRGLITDEDEDGPQERIFTTPDFTLEMRRGDYIGHVLLLASLFLGMREETFILIGTARKSNEAGVQVESWHIWVMTREPNNDGCEREPFEKNAAKIEDLEKREEALTSGKIVFALSKDDRERIAELQTPKEGGNGGNGKDKEDVRCQSGAVKFWELTRSTYFHLPNRWSGFSREKRINIARHGREKHDADKDEDEGEKIIETKEAEIAPLNEDEDSDDDEDLLTEEDMLRFQLKEAEEEYGNDGVVDRNEIFTFREGLSGSSWGRPEEIERIRQLGTSRQASIKADLDKEAQRKADRYSAQSSSKADGFGSRQTWLYDRYFEKRVGAVRAKELPYMKIHVAFNHKNAFVNVHSLIEGKEGKLDGDTAFTTSFDFEKGLKAGWLPLLDETVPKLPETPIGKKPKKVQPIP